MPNDSATRTIVAHGLPCSSPRMPGISPAAQAPEARLGGCFARGLDRALGLGALGAAGAARPRGAAAWRGAASGRSIFGARLRSRVPQYGHSVTYGLTSAWQFLQTTKRSGWDMAVDSTERPSALGELGVVYAAVAATISAMTSLRSWLAS